MNFSKVMSSVSGAFDKAMDAYLYLGTANAAGTLLHIAAILSSGFLMGPKKKGGLTLVDALIQISVADLIPNSALKFINDLWDDFRDPNIDGIVIASPSIKVTRDSDVSEYPVLFAQVQDSTSGITDSTTTVGKQHIIDSCCPHPREWTIDGYLTSINQLDGGLTVKPSLILQTAMLDSFMKSRRPVWFKGADMNFHRVLITHLEIEDKAEVTNSRHISAILREWAVLTLDTELDTALQANSTGESLD